MKIHQKKAKITLVFDGIKVAFSHPLGLTVTTTVSPNLTSLRYVFLYPFFILLKFIYFRLHTTTATDSHCHHTISPPTCSPHNLDHHHHHHPLGRGSSNSGGGSVQIRPPPPHHRFYQTWQWWQGSRHVHVSSLRYFFFISFFLLTFTYFRLHTMMATTTNADSHSHHTISPHHLPHHPPACHVT